jgi:hypothetical protein
MAAITEPSPLSESGLNRRIHRTQDYGTRIRLDQRARASEIARSVNLPISICERFSDREKVVLCCIVEAIRNDGAFDSRLHAMNAGCPLARPTVLKACRKAVDLGLIAVQERQESPIAAKVEIITAKDVDLLQYFAIGPSLIKYRSDWKARSSSSAAK